MKKIFGIILFTSILFANINILSIKEIKTNKVLNIGEKYNKSINKELSKIWNKNITETGNVKLKLTIFSRKGRLEEFKILEKSKGKLFLKELKIFLEELKDIRINRERTEKSFLNIVVDLSFKKQKKLTIHPVSIYKDNSKNIYKKYIKYLINVKGYSLKQIEGILASDKNTISKIMLSAIYNDYTKNDIPKATTFYDIIINQKLEKFVRNTEGLYLCDYLLREEEYELVLEIMPKLSCEFMKEPEASQCHYFRAKSMYHLNDPDYIIPLRKSKDSIPQAKNLLKEIAEKERLEK